MADGFLALGPPAFRFFGDVAATALVGLDAVEEEGVPLGTGAGALDFAFEGFVRDGGGETSTVDSSGGAGRSGRGML